jgi:hypothetical protein
MSKENTSLVQQQATEGNDEKSFRANNLVGSIFKY